MHSMRQAALECVARHGIVTVLLLYEMAFRGHGQAVKNAERIVNVLQLDEQYWSFPVSGNPAVAYELWK